MRKTCGHHFAQARPAGIAGAQNPCKIVDAFELPRRANAAEASLVKTLTRKYSIKVGDLPPFLSRPELKAACEAAGISDQGKKAERLFSKYAYL